MSESHGLTRDLDPNRREEIELVAERMRLTLIEVLGEARGRALYSMDWLRARVFWYLEPQNTTARILLSLEGKGQIIGHAIARLERAENGEPYGYFSTIYIDPAARRQGRASALVRFVVDWFLERRMPKVIYNTAIDHSRLIRLFEQQGFVVTLTEGEMAQLTKILPSANEERGG